MDEKKIICILFLIILSLTGFCEEGEETEDQSLPGEKKEISVIEQWRETLLYGIADEILDVLKKMKDAKETALNNELNNVLSTSVNTDVRKLILEYFTELKYDGAESIGISLLKESNEQEYDSLLIIALINYLAAVKSEELKEHLIPIIENDDNELADTALRAIGKISDISKVEFLLEKLDDPEFPEQRKPTIILVFGDLKAKEAVPALIEIIEDQYEEKIWRMYACDSLGKIGDDRAIPVLKKVFTENDALLRAYAAYALSFFDLSSIIDLLIQGLKDSNWKVRFHCVKALAQKGAEKSVDILMYKAKKDPEIKVRIEAIKALGEIGTKDCFDFIRELFTKKDQSLDIKKTCSDILIEKDLAASLSTIKKVIAEGWDKTGYDFKIVDICAKKLSITESALLEDVFKKFMGSPNMYIRIYGIRGAALNHYGGLKEKIKELSENDPVGVVKREALAALTKM